MKHSYAIILLLVCNILYLPGQNYKTEYVYDQAGNRTTRRVILLNTQKNVAKKAITPLEEKTNLGKITIYPNPTHGVLNINIAGEEENALYYAFIHTSSGEKIIEQIIKGNGIFRIDLSTHSAGIYILSLKSEKKELQYKIIKQ